MMFMLLKIPPTDAFPLIRENKYFNEPDIMNAIKDHYTNVYKYKIQVIFPEFAAWLDIK